MKIIFLLDQIQAGLGGKEHGDQPLGAKDSDWVCQNVRKVIKGKEHGGSCHDLLW